MSMFTRCAHCESTFRVTLAQLQASGGQVRCGVCLEVFDAFVTLTARDPRVPAQEAEEAPPASSDEPVVAAPEPEVGLQPPGPGDGMEPMASFPGDPLADPVPDDTQASPARIVDLDGIGSDPPSVDMPEVADPADVAPGISPEPLSMPVVTIDGEDAVDADVHDEPTIPSELAAESPALDQPEAPAPGAEPPDPESADAADNAAPEPAPTESASEQSSPSLSDEPVPFPDPIAIPLEAAEALSAGPGLAPAGQSVAFAPSRRPRRSLAALASAVFLFLLLGAQVVYLLRATIADAAPSLRPSLEAACSRLHCSIALPRLTDRLTIESSDLQALDPLHPNRVTLTALIRNRARVEQALPLLELTLTDARDEVAARKIFSPAEYLASTPAGAGVGANVELAVRLRLDTGNIVATGYRLYLFHP